MEKKKRNKQNLALTCFILLGLGLLTAFVLFHKGDLPKNPIEQRNAKASTNYQMGKSSLEISKETVEAWKRNGLDSKKEAVQIQSDSELDGNQNTEETDVPDLREKEHPTGETEPDQQKDQNLNEEKTEDEENRNERSRNEESGNERNVGNGKVGAGTGNTGTGNTGTGNTGNGNTGTGNTGNGNTGNGNTGTGNAGTGNTGAGNTGAGNAGNGNTGTGNGETGNKEEKKDDNNKENKKEKKKKQKKETPEKEEKKTKKEEEQKKKETPEEKKEQDQQGPDENQKTEEKDQEKENPQNEDPQNDPAQQEEKLEILTDLESQTVAEDRISFQASLVHGSKKAKLSVIVNGKALSGENNQYTAALTEGKNTIRLKAVDTGQESVSKEFVIEYLPVATEETEPKLVSINVSDGMEIGGSSYTLDVSAQDYLGNPLYYESISVKLNQKEIQYRWSSAEVFSYYLELLSGENILELRLTDHQGRYVDKVYHLNCTYIAEGTPMGTVHLSMDARVLGLPDFLDTSAEIYYGDSLAEVICRVLEQNGFGIAYSGSLENGFYLEAVEREGITNGWRIDEGLCAEIEEDGLLFNQNPETGEWIYQADSLGQLDFCQGSGWISMVNGESLSYGLSDYTVKPGDDIRIRYTLAYGKDLGAYSGSGGGQGVKEYYEHIY